MDELRDRYLNLKNILLNKVSSIRLDSIKESAEISIQMSIIHSKIANEYFYGDRKDAALYILFGFKKARRFSKNGFDFIYCDHNDLGDFVIGGSEYVDDCYIVIHDNKFKNVADFGSYHQKIIRSYEIMGLESALDFFRSI